jgi:hypothetical protein
MAKGKVTTNPLIDSLFERAGIVSQKPNQTWSSLNDIYMAIAQSIVETGEQVNQCIAMIRSAGIENNKELSISVNGLTRDITAYTETLLQINAQHSKYSGDVKNGDELALCLSLYEDYLALHNRMRANTLPVILTVTEHLSAAQSVIEQAKKDELTDPNVVSDIEVKVKTND